MQSTQRGDRTHIGIFGRCNVGKSSLLNALTGQQAAIVSPMKGTTTDPVSKTMELLPLGPVVLVDTPGLDDTTLVGAQRLKRTQQVLRRTDIALLVTEGGEYTAEEQELLQLLQKTNTPTIVVANKQDLRTERPSEAVAVSAKTGQGIEALKEALAKLRPTTVKRELLDGLVQPEDLFVLVTPIDEGAPKGRLILPQQRTIRELLDTHGAALVVQPAQLPSMLERLNQPPALVIVDSQVFRSVAPMVPKEIPLTSFSILFARFKGILKDSVAGVRTVEQLSAGDRVLISEGCTHHRQCEDIGTDKIPRGLTQHTGKELSFDFTSGSEFPEDLTSYRLVVHCGGCMLGDTEVLSRLQQAKAQGVKMTNYGILLSFLHGTLDRSLQVFESLGLE